MSILAKAHFHNEEAALAKLESIVWPEGPRCPHCGSERSSQIKGKTARPGLRACGACRKQYTVTVDTIFHRSHVPLHKWFQAAHLLASSKKGISAHQLHRTLNVTYKTAWFMAHRIREAMKDSDEQPLGGWGKIVEADETFIGNKKGYRRKPGVAHKMKVLSLVERGGKLRSVVVNKLNQGELGRILKANIRRHSNLMTDSASYYRRGIGFPKHKIVNHEAGEYVRGNAHTNTLEGYFSIFKRGMRGVYQHCSEKHLHRYVAEFDYRYNARNIDDCTRAENAIYGIVGKRLTYRDSSVS